MPEGTACIPSANPLPERQNFYSRNKETGVLQLFCNTPVLLLYRLFFPEVIFPEDCQLCHQTHGQGGKEVHR